MGNLGVAAVLLDNEADVNTADSIGMTPLHWAALTGNLQMVELLLARYASVDSRDYFAGGITPYGIAKLLGYNETIELMQNRYAIF
ncbi:MAG: ankyrin repeat domain-containing protein [Candidatus Hydrogenedentes bacterium]|jgi:ankyrin repeat protein|nr:ankyrin repeat domain-containing protein [Candidatus Hydrogenedentota bacterium]